MGEGETGDQGTRKEATWVVQVGGDDRGDDSELFRKTCRTGGWLGLGARWEMS